MPRITAERLDDRGHLMFNAGLLLKMSNNHNLTVPQVQAIFVSTIIRLLSWPTSAHLPTYPRWDNVSEGST
jgi:hypothetical protein